MSSKEFCESGKHIYKERDVVTTVFEVADRMKVIYVVVKCDKCDSQFLREVERLL